MPSTNWWLKIFAENKKYNFVNIVYKLLWLMHIFFLVKMRFKKLQISDDQNSLKLIILVFKINSDLVSITS